LKQKGSKNLVVCYFGDGAASEGDFHAGMNFAATLQCPVIFFCRNNKWAISTPTLDQYRGDAIAGRGVAYGMDTVRVDGNDFFAVYNATKEARSIALKNSRPVLIEAMTYRVGPHSSSDDWTKYRPADEVTTWLKDNNPIYRLADYLMSKGWWTDEETKSLISSAKSEVLTAVNMAKREKRPHLDHLFTDVYDNLPLEIQAQKKELNDHLAKYRASGIYPTQLYSSEL